jgi:hypothetical protein
MKKLYNDATLSLRLPKSMEQQLDKIAGQKHIATGSLCRMILSEWIQNNAGSLLVNAIENKPKPINKPAPPKSRARNAYTEDDRRLDEWVRANQITTDKETAYGDDW